MADLRELSTDPAVKSANTPAVAADFALVVALSPNNAVALSAGKNNVTIADTQADIHGQLVGVTRLTQITTKFFQQSPSNFLNVTVAGGATATGPTAGAAIFATGTAVTASLLAQTPVGILYAAQYEAWAVLSGAYTAPTSAASFQRLGIYDTANGYSIGYNGLTFGLWVRANSVDTFIAQTTWNKDVLSGATTSTFTSNGAPVALVPTNLNMFRVRYGWYGGVSAYFEVYAPDGNWVLVHQVRTVNAQASVNMTMPDLPMTVEVSKTASDATNLVITCGGWAAGITSPSSGPNISGQKSIAALNAAVVVPLSGLGELSFTVAGTWVGTLSFQHSIDGLLWNADAPLTGIPSTFATSTAVNGIFTAAIASSRFYRVVATAWTSGSASIFYSGAPSANLIVSQSLITDGSNNGPAAVKSASTSAVATDPALVVAMNPTTPLTNIATSSASTALHTANVTVGLSVGANLPITGYGTSVIKVTGTFVASFVFKVSVDAGATWDNISGTQVGGGDIFTTATQAGSYRFTVAGFDLLRVEVTLTSGSITINGKSTNAVNASKIVKLATSGLVIGALVANQSVNKAQINGVAPLMGNGVSGTGSQRVNIASDNTAFPVNAALAAETTKVIGTVNIAAAQAVTANAGTNLNTSALSLDATQTNHTQRFQAVTALTAVSVANTAVTLTLPAVAAQFHYVARIRISMHNTSAAAVVGSAVTLAFTSTNIPGALAWTEGNALAAGMSKTVVDEILENPVKVSTVNTATTIAAPACGAGVLVRITAYYYTAA